MKIHETRSAYTIYHSSTDRVSQDWYKELLDLGFIQCFPVAHQVKNPPAVRETWVGSLGQEDSPGEGKGYPLQYSGLENSMDCIVHGIAKSRTPLRDLHFHFPLQKNLLPTKFRLLEEFSSRSCRTKVPISLLAVCWESFSTFRGHLIPWFTPPSSLSSATASHPLSASSFLPPAGESSL